MKEPRIRNAWRLVFVASVIAVGVADAVVLDLTKAYFGSGYNSHALHTFGERAAFFAASAVIDVGFLAALWLAALGVLRLHRTRPLMTVGAAAVSGLIVPLSFDIAMNRLHRVLGDVLELRLMLDLAGGSWSSALGEASQDLPPVALLCAGAFGAIVAFWTAVRWAERRVPALRGVAPPPARTLAWVALVGVLGGGALLAATSHLAPAIHFGLGNKPAGRIETWLADEATDFDRDGVGLVSRPRDPAPFDAAIHPWAVEIPGNGIDEDGFAGDLPLSELPAAESFPPLQPGPAPVRTFVLILLESFRADVVGLRFRGLDVTPNLNRLAREGASARAAYAHVPMTWASRAQLMQGRTYPTRTGSTLVDDFVARGYEVAWFSGQHDGVGAGELRLGTELASRFYDARDDVSLRTSRSAQPISLQVSWKTVLRRVTEYLEKRGPGSSPLFLYVNLVDTHFPYWHREIDDLLGVGSLPRERIRPENREEVWRAYLNAAANVDRAIGELLEATGGGAGGAAVLVTADHGQAFYERGLLGHGQALDDAQTRVPLISSGIGDGWPSLVGLADVRGNVRAWLAGRDTAPAKAHEITQVLGDLNQPVAVGIRDASGATVTQLSTLGVIRLVEGADPRELQAAEGIAPLRAWEGLRASEGANDAAPAR